MRIAFWVGGMPFNDETLKTQSLGGSESAGYFLSEELSKRGHQVFLFTSLAANPRSIKKDGGGSLNILYHGQPTPEAPLGHAFEQYMRDTPIDVAIIQRVPYAFHKQWNTKVCIWQLHDLALYRSATEMMGGLWQIDAITTVSNWHAEQVKKIWNISPETLRVVPNGVDPVLYTNPENLDPPKFPEKKFILLYQSRPERGLFHLVRPGGIMDKCQELGLPVHLMHCTYSAGTVPHLQNMYNQLEMWSNALPNVSNMGSLTKNQLAMVQQHADMLIYPTEFEEVSCITVMEAMHAALPVLTTDSAALPETLEGAGCTIVPLVDGKVNEEEFVSKLKLFFSGDGYPKVLNEQRALQREAATKRTWAAATDRLEAVINECFATRQSSTGAILRDAIEHSDIGFAKWLLERTPTAQDDHIVNSAREEIDEMYSFQEDPEEYAAHYLEHQTRYYNEFEEKVIGEDVTQTNRFKGVLTFVSESINRKKGQTLRILDYGCAHGHYTIPLAKLFKRHEFKGIDISERAVGAARKWKERDGVTNVEFVQGSHQLLLDMSAEDGERFDIILAGEVLEHVMDYSDLLITFQKLLKPEGSIVATTPTGRWEHSGTEEFRKAREHVHHFERGDLEDILRGHEHEILHAPSGHDRSGFALGSFVWCVWPRPELPLWRVNYERKLAQYAPRQSISACLIVKDGEATLKQCIESIVDWVDEVWIYIDPATRDQTEMVAIDLADKFLLKPIKYLMAKKSAMLDGFSEARNESIEHATGDWILWLDADEVVKGAWNLHRLAKPSMHQGYGLPQVHYSADPDKVLTTDFPCRFFRNHRGVQFYGYVHEHPETVMGEAVKWSIVRGDVKFLHMGYVDEETRRKRFYRNFPLLQKDIEKYPTERPLNRFLKLRDIAQSIMFDSEKTGGAIFEHHIKLAKEGIAVMEELVEKPHPKMVLDAMDYYSACVAASQLPAFDAEVSIKTVKHEAQSLNVGMVIKGKFHSREFFFKMIERFSKESTKQYEDRYL